MPRYLIDKNAICQEPTCPDKVKSREYCAKHYMLVYRNKACKCKVEGCSSRWLAKSKPYCRRHLKDQTAPLTKFQRLPRQFTIQDLKDRTLPNEDGCWLWQGTLVRGYAQIEGYVDNVRFSKAHRLAYALVNGIPEKGMQIHHACANSSCINPEHLSAVSLEANLAEMHERRRYSMIIADLSLENHKLRERLAKYEPIVTTTVASH